MEAFGRTVFFLVALWPVAASAQVRGMDPIGGGIGAAGAGAVITQPMIPNFNTNLNTNLSTQIYSAPAPAQAAPAQAAPAQAAPAQAEPAAAPAEPAPVAAPSDDSGQAMAAPSAPSASPSRQPLLWAKGIGTDQSQECDMSEAARESCSGPACLIACLADACPGQENTACEFAIDCAAEITADLVSGDQPCDENVVEHTQVSTVDGIATVNIIRLPAGESCKPPPCSQ